MKFSFVTEYFSSIPKFSIGNSLHDAKTPTKGINNNKGMIGFFIAVVINI
jgi:hypothetical protein